MNYENHQAVELSSDVPNQADEYVESQEEMVEITWNGSVFFVPKDSINVSDGYTGVDVDDSDHNIPMQSSATKQSEFHENPLIPPDGDKIIPTAAVGYGFNTRSLRCIGPLTRIVKNVVFSTVPAPPKRSLQTIGIPEPIREHFQSLDLHALRQMQPDDARYKEIPLRYHSAMPLDTSPTALVGCAPAFYSCATPF
jgi:hypothetical protein